MTANAMEQVVSTGRADVVRVEDRHAPAVAAFMREVWGEDVPPEKLRMARAAAAAANPIAPGEEPPSFIFLAGERVLGHLGTIPVRLWCRGADEPAHWLKGLMVVPSHRNGPVGFYLLREATRQLGCAMALVVELAARRLFVAHGFTDLGAIPNYLRILEPGKVLRQLDLEAIGLSGLPHGLAWALRTAQRPGMAAPAGAVLDGAFRLWAAGAGIRSHRGIIQKPERIPGGDLDPLWRRVRAGIGAGVARERAYIEGRYGRREASKYHFVTVGESGGLGGFGVIRAPRARATRASRESGLRSSPKSPSRPKHLSLGCRCSPRPKRPPAISGPMLSSALGATRACRRSSSGAPSSACLETSTSWPGIPPAKIDYPRPWMNGG